MNYRSSKRSVAFLFIPLVVTIPSISTPPCYIDCN
ncbi:hypothetical protein V3C99_004704 [Haemonchus contortus]